MAMPWSHRLPDFARLDPVYGENLLDLARLLAADGPIDVLDVGANIGDSTLLILDRAQARVLAVEPDEVFLPFLRHNVRDNDRVAIEPSLLSATDVQESRKVVRIGGTATYQPTDDDVPVPMISVAELRDRHPSFAGLRLVKSDTDGYDVALVPAIARAWADAKPVLFFEYDHRASEVAGNPPLAVWDELAALGYTECAVWDNGGHPLHRCSLAAARELAEQERPSSPGGFWDVAAVHATDAHGIAALDALIPRG
jgi:FkbM family methyltransferase